MNDKVQDICILLVEDDEHSRYFISIALYKIFEKVYIAKDGVEGLELFKAHLPEIVIADIGMPRMDGLTMSEKIKEIEPLTNIIINTAFDNTNMLRRAIKIGINNYIIKPVILEDINKTIKDAIAEVRMRLDFDAQQNHIKTLYEALEHNTSMVFSLDSDYNFTFVNNRLKDFSIYRKEQIIGKSIFNFVLNYNSKGLQKFRDALENKVSHKDEAFIKLAEERSLWVSYSISPVFTREGSLKYYLVVFDDITKKKKQEKYLIESRKLLEEEVKKRTLELREINYKLVKEIEVRSEIEQDLILAKKKAEEANTAKSMFMAKVSHELRTPLNGILGMASIMIDTELNSKQRRFIEVIKSSGESLLKIINDILDYTKLGSGKLSIHNTKTGIYEVVMSAINIIKPLAEDKGLNLQYNLDDVLPEFLFVDGERLKQIILNLLSNSVKFTDEGYIRLDVKLVEYESDIATLQFSVTDTGYGIAQDKHNLLFESFSQIESTMTRKKGGTGLGLAIAKDIVELMNGEIWCESTPNVGSIFYFTIKAQKVNVEEIEPTTIKNLDDIFKPRNLKIMIADDSEINVEVLKSVLGDNFKIVVAKNGSEAIKKYYEQKIDLIFMDVNMPEIDGLQAAKMIRSKEEFTKSSPVPIICITGDANKDKIYEYYAAGMNDYLTKPIDPNEIKLLIQKYLHSKAKINKNNSKVDLTNLIIAINQKPDILKKLIAHFENKSQESLYSIYESLEVKDFLGARKKAHKFKSELLNFATINVKNDISDLENAIKFNNLELSLEMFEKVKLDYEEIKNYLLDHTPDELIKTFSEK